MEALSFLVSLKHKYRHNEYIFKILHCLFSGSSADDCDQATFTFAYAMVITDWVAAAFAFAFAAFALLCTV